MTATEMYGRFMDSINESANDSVLSITVARYLNNAQRQLFNDLYYNRMDTRGKGMRPAYGFEDTNFLGDALAPFERLQTLDTNDEGVIPLPTELAHLTAVSARISGVLSANTDNPCATQRAEHSVDGYAPVSFFRKNEQYAGISNKFTKPVWDNATLPCQYRYRPKYVNVTLAGARAIRILPELAYKVRLDYVIDPPEIRIQTPLVDLDYAGTPGFVNVAADVNSVFPAFLHDEIVKRAVMLFSTAIGDYESSQVENQLITAGRN